MSAQLETLNRELTDLAGNGNAGLGSNFLDLAHAKVKPGGTIAFVLPFTVVAGKDWSKARELLASHYRDVCVVAIATTGATERAFSADTGMAEVLIIATQMPARRRTRSRRCALREPVRTARQFGRGGGDGPQDRRHRLSPPPPPPLKRSGSGSGSGSVDIGDTRVGSFIWAGIHDGGCAGATEPDLAICASSLANGRLLAVAAGGASHDVPLAELGELGIRGPVPP